MKFEIGDKVRVMRADWNRMPEAILIETQKLLGKTGIVEDSTSCSTVDMNFVYVNFSHPDMVNACHFDENNCLLLYAESLDLVEKGKPKYWTGKVICTEYLDPYGFNLLTVGKVYSVKNGTLIDDKATTWRVNIKDINDLNRDNYNVKFIEFKGFNE